MRYKKNLTFESAFGQDQYNHVTGWLKRLTDSRPIFAWALLALIAMPSLALAQSVFNGTWKIEPGSYKTSAHMTFLLKDGEYRFKGPGQPGYQIKADGHFHKVEGQPRFDMEAVRIIDDHTVESTRKKDGNKVGDATFSVNPDGKTEILSFSHVNNGRVFKGKSILTRVAEGPAGSHAISGTWRMQRGVSSSASTVTYKINGRDIDFHSSEGDSYHAKLDGKETTVVGGEAGEKMSVVKLGGHKLRETYWVNDKVGTVSVTTVAPDGRTATVVTHDLDTGVKTSLTLTKQ